MHYGHCQCQERRLGTKDHAESIQIIDRALDAGTRTMEHLESQLTAAGVELSRKV